MALVERLPQDEPEQPVPVKPQVTAVFETPDTLAVKSCVPTVGTDALVGLMLNKMAAATTMVMLAEADLVESAALVAVTVTAAGVGTLAGEVYKPVVEIVPHAAPVQPEPPTVHVTPVLAFPVTVAANG